MAVDYKLKNTRMIFENAEKIPHVRVYTIYKVCVKFWTSNNYKQSTQIERSR